MINYYKYAGKLSALIEFSIKNARIITGVGEDIFMTPYISPPLYHHHVKHEIFFARQGECNIKIDGNDYCLKANSFMYIPVMRNHHFGQSSENARIFALQFDFKKSKKHADIMNIDFFKVLNSLFSSDSEPRVFGESIRVFEKFDEWRGMIQNIPAPLYDEYFEYSFIQFFIEVIYRMDENLSLLKGNQKIPAPLSDKTSAGLSHDISLSAIDRQSYINIIEDYFFELPYGKTSLAELAGRLKLSAPYTKRLIRRLYNMNFTELSALSKINMAKGLILETDLSFENVAEKIGYSYKGFLNAFKNITGMTPSEFKKQLNARPYLK